MLACALSFRKAVRPVWIRHEGENFIVFDQFVDQHFSIAVMNIVIARAVDKQEIAFQISGIFYW